jgi:excinuclease ABC subunit B
MYADNVTRSMREAMDETARRREKQLNFNLEHQITPRTIVKEVETPFDNLFAHGDNSAAPSRGKKRRESSGPIETRLPADPAELAAQINKLEKAMRDAAKDLEFEKAAELRDHITFLRGRFILSGAETAGSQ